jgi:hypothetical protein
VEGRVIYGIEIGIVVWSLRGEDEGKKIVMPADGMKPVIVILEQEAKKRPRKVKHSSWLDQSRLLLRGRK